MRSISALLLGATITLTCLITACSSSGSSTSDSNPATGGTSGSPASAASTCDPDGPTSTDPALAAAQATLKKAVTPSTTWDGPASGPKAQTRGATVVFVPQLSSNAGDLGVENGLKEAATAIGWNLKVIDGGGTTANNLAALEQAIALKPAGIVLSSFDPKAAAADFAKAKSAGIPIVANHTGTEPGPPSGATGLFTNVTSDPATIAKIAAACAIVASGGKAGVTIVGCGTEVEICQTKEDAMVNEIKSCSGCTVLAHEDYAFENASQREGSIAAADYQKFGSRLTYMLSINDIYYDAAIPALRALGVGQSGPPLMIAAGDGSPTAFDRIREGEYQIATVAEPLNEHGWQLADELNRAIANQQPTSFVTYPHLVTKANVDLEGGKNNTYDPDNGYREHYKQIWGVS